MDNEKTNCICDKASFGKIRADKIFKKIDIHVVYEKDKSVLCNIIIE